jgi:hypothetical protein
MEFVSRTGFGITTLPCDETRSALSNSPFQSERTRNGRLVEQCVLEACEQRHVDLKALKAAVRCLLSDLWLPGRPELDLLSPSRSQARGS